jgi:predicted hydrocarbon binding protein
LEEKLGKEEMKQLCVEMGEYQVEQALGRYKDRYGIDEVSREKIISYVDNILKVLGWGEIDIKSAENGEIKVVVKHPTLPSVYRNKNEELSEEPICHYLRGLLNKGINVTHDLDVKLEETQCAATGGDTCIFESTIS